MKRFNDKVVIITGADSSLGHATALRLAREGANVVLIGLNDKVLSHIADELPEDHTWINAGNHLSVTSDITNHEQAERLVQHVVDKYHRIDALININTDITIEAPLLEELSKTKGNIVEVSLLSDTDSEWSMAAYAGAKNDIAKRAIELAHQYSAHGVRANAVVIGLTTEDKDDVDNVSDFIAQSPLGELVELEEAVEAIAFLADEDNRLLTGVALPVDGGLSLKL